MKQAVVLALLACCGCVNLYTRSPSTDPQITRCYQSTDAAASLACVAAFPQLLGEERGLAWANLLTVPCLGLPCAVDTALEAVVDTLFLPGDLWLARTRKRKERK